MKQLSLPKCNRVWRLSRNLFWNIMFSDRFKGQVSKLSVRPFIVSGKLRLLPAPVSNIIEGKWKGKRYIPVKPKSKLVTQSCRNRCLLTPELIGKSVFVRRVVTRGKFSRWTRPLVKTMVTIPVPGVISIFKITSRRLIRNTGSSFLLQMVPRAKQFSVMFIILRR